MLALANMSIRVAALAGRFALSIFLARYFDLSILGIYGIVQGINGILPPSIGLGLNYYLNRETVGVDPFRSGPMIRDRLIVTSAGLIAVFFCIALWGALFARSSQMIYAAMIPIVILETYFFDIQLSLFSLRKPLLANTLLFIRGALWCAPFMLIAYFFPQLRTLPFLVCCWIMGQVCSLVLLGWHFRNWPWRQILSTSFDKEWIVSRLKQARLIYLGDIGQAGYTFLDRFLIAAYLGLSVTGRYTFLQSIALGLQTMITSGIIQISLPNLVQTFREDGFDKWQNLLRRLLVKTFFSSVVGATILYIATLSLLPLIHRSDTLAYKWVFLAMLAGSVIKMSSDLISYGLYSQGKDRHLALVNASSIVIVAISTMISLKYLGLQGLSIALIVAPGFVLLIRLYYLSKPIELNGSFRNKQDNSKMEGRS